jgi:predicted nucleic acid-binding protein
MKYILDSSVAFKWEVPEPDSDKAIRLRDDYQQGVHDLLSPDFFPIEIAHALTRAERQNRILVGQAAVFWTNIMTSPPILCPVDSLVPRAIAISSRMRIGVYDCLYVALAEREGCELVTGDDKLVKNLQAAFPFVVLLASLP